MGHPGGRVEGRRRGARHTIWRAMTDRTSDIHRLEAPSPRAAPPSRRWRFLADYVWLVLKNVIGWVLILASLVAGPLVPGPGGIPLFLIGFALVSFPGKRRLTARVLRGRPVRFRHLPFALVSAGVALVVPAVVWLVVDERPWWVAGVRAAAVNYGPGAAVSLYLTVVAVLWVLARATPHVLNLALRIVSRGRRTFRPWLRHHHIHLLPPRWRCRHPHEPGTGPFRLTDEIVRFTKRHRRHD